MFPNSTISPLAIRWVLKAIRFGVIILLIVALTGSAITVSAQGTSSPTYVVQPGDTLNDIAGWFGVSVDDLISANDIQDPNLISAGTSLVIPGLEGISGVLTSKIVTVGETLSSLLKIYRIPKSTFNKINRITSPSELYIGSAVIIPMDNAGHAGTFVSGKQGLSIFEQAIILNSNPWKIMAENLQDNLWECLPADNLFVKSNSNQTSPSLISPLIINISISPLPVRQGSTVEIQITSDQTLSLSGNLNGFDLHFFESEPGNMWHCREFMQWRPSGWRR